MESDLLGMHHASSSDPHPILHSALLVLATLAAVVLVRLLWPEASRAELLWTIDPPEAARQHIRRLILPPEAIRLRPADTSPTSAAGSCGDRRSGGGGSGGGGGGSGGGGGGGGGGATSPSPSSSLGERSTVVQRVLTRGHEAASLLRSPSGKQRPHPSPHAFVFDPTVAAAHDVTPLLVFVNPGSGGRQGQAALAQLRSLLSPQQAVGSRGSRSGEIWGDLGRSEEE